jgi:hypothetical protein
MRPDQVAREDMQAMDALVRPLLTELADAVWGRNGRLRRTWRLTHEGSTWRVTHDKRAEVFRVTVDLAQRQFQVDCHAGPIVTDGIGDEQLRRALAVAHHRGPAHPGEI